MRKILVAIVLALMACAPASASVLLKGAWLCSNPGHLEILYIAMKQNNIEAARQIFGDQICERSSEAFHGITVVDRRTIPTMYGDLRIVRLNAADGVQIWAPALYVKD